MQHAYFCSNTLDAFAHATAPLTATAAPMRAADTAQPRACRGYEVLSMQASLHSASSDPSQSEATDTTFCSAFTSPRLAPSACFAGTTMPRDGWILPCSLCRAWTGSSVQPSETEDVPCCKKCEPRYWRLRYQSSRSCASTTAAVSGPSELPPCPSFSAASEAYRQPMAMPQLISASSSCFAAASLVMQQEAVQPPLRLTTPRSKRSRQPEHPEADEQALPQHSSQQRRTPVKAVRQLSLSTSDPMETHPGHPHRQGRRGEDQVLKRQALFNAAYHRSASCSSVGADCRVGQPSVWQEATASASADSWFPAAHRGLCRHNTDPLATSGAAYAAALQAYHLQAAPGAYAYAAPMFDQCHNAGLLGQASLPSWSLLELELTE